MYFLFGRRYFGPRSVLVRKGGVNCCRGASFRKAKGAAAVQGCVCEHEVVQAVPYMPVSYE